MGLRNPILSPSHYRSLTSSTAVIHRSLDSVMPVISHGHFSDMKITEVNTKTALRLLDCMDISYCRGTARCAQGKAINSPAVIAQGFP